MKTFCFFVFFFYNYLMVVHAAESTTGNSTANSRTSSFGVKDIELERIYQGCIAQQSRDQICQMVIAAKAVGEDAIETIKELIPMGPYEYAILTSANFAATGRLRIRTPSLVAHWEGTIDYDRDGSILFVLKKGF